MEIFFFQEGRLDDGRVFHPFAWHSSLQELANVNGCIGDILLRLALSSRSFRMNLVNISNRFQFLENVYVRQFF